MTKRECTTLVLSIVFIVAGLTGCDRSGHMPEKAAASTTDNSSDVRDLLTLINEKDSTNAAVVQSTAALNQVYDRLLFLATRRRAPTKATVQETAVMYSTLDSLSSIVRAGKAHLQTIDQRLASMQNKNPMIMSAVPVIRQNITGMQSGMAMQETGVKGLQDDVKDFKKRTEKRLVDMARARALQAKLAQTGAAPAQTGQELYYVVGTEKELLNRKIVQEAGGTDLWIFGKLGVTLQPSKELPQNEFIRYTPKQGGEINIDSVIAQTTGKSGKKPKHFKVVSAQNEKFIEPLMDTSQTIRKLKINDEEKFWKPSPYLIIVVDED